MLGAAGIKYDDVTIYEPVYSAGSAVDCDFVAFTSAGAVVDFSEMAVRFPPGLLLLR